METIAIITYDIPHRKTQDLVYRLILKGYKICLIFIPFEKRKPHNPLYEHRPLKPIPVENDDFCRKLDAGFFYTKIDKIEDLCNKINFHSILIGGAGILPKGLVTKHEIINAHPGYLPNIRGLDALKWAIYEGQPIGVTTHYISKEADRGVLIDRKIIPVYFEDTFHSLAQRVYETELEMLVDSIEAKPDGMSLKDRRYPLVHKRMPKNKEIIMMERFETLRKNSEFKTK